MTHLTDSEVVKTLYAAGIPASYHHKSMGLDKLKIDGWGDPVEGSQWADKDAKEFATLGKGIEISFDGKPAYDFTYLLARKLQLLAVPVNVVSLPVLAEIIASRHETENAERMEEWNSSSFLFIITAFGADSPPYDRTRMFEMEWFLRSWMLAGRSLVMQGDGNLRTCEWWSKGLRSLFADRLGLRFNGPPETKQVFDEHGKPVATVVYQKR